jgi:hypothetical protein
MEDSMLRNSSAGSTLSRCFTLSLAGALFVSSCASTPSRTPAADRTPLTYEQLQRLEEVGVAILSTAMMGNRVSQEAKVAADLKKRLTEIGVNGEPRSANGMLVGLVGFFGLTMGMQSTGLSHAILERSLKDGAADRSGTITAIAFVVGYAAVASVSVGESSGSSTFLRKAPEKDAHAAAATERKRLQAEFDSELKETVDRYATIFQLTASGRLVLARTLKTAAIDAAKAAPAEYSEVRVNVPAAMVEAKLISEADYEGFLEIVDVLQKSTRSEAAVDRVTDGKLYGENLALVKQTLSAYVEWLRSARTGLSAEATKKIDAAIARAERLLQRI